MRLHVLGCHGPYPCADGATSGYLMEHEGAALLIDCGAGVLGRLMRLFDPADLSAVLLSHLHFDHASDLLVLSYYLEKMGKTLPVYVPPEDQSPFAALLSARAFRLIPYPDELKIAGLSVSSFPVRHPVPCRALRFSDGQKTFVYTGDTNDCPGLADFARAADALLADAAFLQEEWKETLPHMSATGAAELARQADAGRLYLTHLPVTHDPETLTRQARAVFPDSQAVYPGMVIDL